MTRTGGDARRISKRIARITNTNAEPHPPPPKHPTTGRPLVQDSRRPTVALPARPLQASPTFRSDTKHPTSTGRPSRGSRPCCGAGVSALRRVGSVAHFREGFRVRSVHRHRHHAHQMLLMVSCGSGAGAPRAGALSPPVTAP